MSENKTQFDYLLNAFELASQADKPAEHGYAEKRRALFAYVRELEEGWTASRQKALQEAATWQPIETAPKVGCEVLLAEGDYVCTGFWHDGSECHGHRGGAGWFSEDDRHNLLIASNIHPTHWMPLPPPPGALGSSGDGSPASTDDGQMNRMDEMSRTLGGTSKDGEHG